MPVRRCSVCPCMPTSLLAQSSGVTPFLFRASSAAPASNSTCTASSSPSYATCISAVAPLLSLVSVHARSVLAATLLAKQPPSKRADGARGFPPLV